MKAFILIIFSVLLCSNCQGSPGQASKLVIPLYQLEKDPTPDGNLKDWKPRWHMAELKDSSDVIFGSRNWQSFRDGSCKFFSGYTEEYFDFGIEVNDKEIETDKPLPLCDHLQISIGDVMAMIKPTVNPPGRQENIRFFLGQTQPVTRPAPEGCSIAVAMKSSGDGYFIEGKIPWIAFDIVPKKDLEMKFALSVTNVTGKNDHFFVMSTVRRGITQVIRFAEKDMGKPIPVILSKAVYLPQARGDQFNFTNLGLLAADTRIQLIYHRVTEVGISDFSVEYFDETGQQRSLLVRCPENYNTTSLTNKTIVSVTGILVKKTGGQLELIADEDGIEIAKPGDKPIE